MKWTPGDVCAALDEVQSAEVVGVNDGRPWADCDGDVELACDNGWGVVVFNDCSEWDYIDSVRPPGGDWIRLWPANYSDHAEVERLERWSLVRNWQPSRRGWSTWCPDCEGHGSRRVDTAQRLCDCAEGAAERGRWLERLSRPSVPRTAGVFDRVAEDERQRAALNAAVHCARAIVETIAEDYEAAALSAAAAVAFDQASYLSRLRCAVPSDLYAQAVRTRGEDVPGEVSDDWCVWVLEGGPRDTPEAAMEHEMREREAREAQWREGEVIGPDDLVPQVDG